LSSRPAPPPWKGNPRSAGELRAASKRPISRIRSRHSREARRRGDRAATARRSIARFSSLSDVAIVQGVASNRCNALVGEAAHVGSRTIGSPTLGHSPPCRIYSARFFFYFFLQGGAQRRLALEVQSPPSGISSSAGSCPAPRVWMGARATPAARRRRRTPRRPGGGRILERDLSPVGRGGRQRSTRHVDDLPYRRSRRRSDSSSCPPVAHAGPPARPAPCPRQRSAEGNSGVLRERSPHRIDAAPMRRPLARKGSKFARRRSVAREPLKGRSTSARGPEIMLHRTAPNTAPSPERGRSTPGSASGGQRHARPVDQQVRSTVSV